MTAETQKKLAGHFKHPSKLVTFPVVMNDPEGQSAMELFPEQYIPTGHGTHALLSCAGILPGPQVVHVDAPAGETCRAGHSKQLSIPLKFPNVPAGQGEHRLAPVAAYVPNPH